jgi:hypothetical protein
MLHVVASRKPLDRVARDLEDLSATPGLKEVAREVEPTLEAIMAEAASW